SRGYCGTPSLSTVATSRPWWPACSSMSTGNLSLTDGYCPASVAWRKRTCVARRRHFRRSWPPLVSRRRGISAYLPPDADEPAGPSLENERKSIGECVLIRDDERAGDGERNTPLLVRKYPSGFL